MPAPRLLIVSVLNVAEGSRGAQLDGADHVRIVHARRHRHRLPCRRQRQTWPPGNGGAAFNAYRLFRAPGVPRLAAPAAHRPPPVIAPAWAARARLPRTSAPRADRAGAAHASAPSGLNPVRACATAAAFPQMQAGCCRNRSSPSSTDQVALNRPAAHPRPKVEFATGFTARVVRHHHVVEQARPCAASARACRSTRTRRSAHRARGHGELVHAPLAVSAVAPVRRPAIVGVRVLQFQAAAAAVGP